MLRAGATIKDDMYFFGVSLEKGGGKGNPLATFRPQTHLRMMG